MCLGRSLTYLFNVALPIRALRSIDAHSDALRPSTIVATPTALAESGPLASTSSKVDNSGKSNPGRSRGKKERNKERKVAKAASKKSKGKLPVSPAAPIELHDAAQSANKLGYISYLITHDSNHSQIRSSSRANPRATPSRR